MATIADLNVRIGAQIEGFQRGMQRVERDLRRSGERLSALGTDLTVSLSAPLALLGVSAMKTAGDLERYGNALTSTMGNAEAAAAELAKLKTVAKDPGINFEQAIKGSVRLQAVKLDAETARKAIQNFGNAISLAGGTSEDLDGVTLALTQIISKGKVSAEEINQLAERVPQIREAMKSAFGTADTEALQKRGLDATQFVKVVTEEMGKLPKATGGISNAFENAGMVIKDVLATIGNDLITTFDILNKTNAFSEWATGAIASFQALDGDVKRFIYTFAGVVIAAGPAIKVYGVLKSTLAQVISVGSSLVGLLSRLGGGVLTVAEAFSQLDKTMKRNVIIALASVAAAAIAAGAAFYQYRSAIDATKVSKSQLASAVKAANAESANELGRMGALIGELQNVTTSTDRRKNAVDRLREIYPDYLKNIDLEKLGTAELTQLQSDLTRETLKSISARNKQAAIVGVLEQQAAAMLRIEQLRNGAEVTTSEVGLIDTGEMWRAGSRSAAVIIKLQEQVNIFGENATKVGEEFDRAFAGVQNTAQNRGAATAAALKWLGRGAAEATNTTTTATTTATKASKERAHALSYEARMLKEIAEADKEAADAAAFKAKYFGNTNPITELAAPDLSKRILQPLAGAVDPLLKYRDALTQVSTAHTVLDNSAAYSAEKLLAFQQAAQSIVDSGVQNGIVALMENIGAGLAGVGGKMNVLQILLGGVADMMLQLGKMAIASGVTIEALKKALATFSGIGAIVAGAALVAVGSAIKARLSSMSVPALAQGGLAYAPTLALVGDNKGARANPEVIAPLSKLRGMLEDSGGGGNLTGTIKADGRDLLLIIERQMKAKGRTGL
jgi:tape measure domain-containing protein